MATVYRAYDPMFEHEVALKILQKELLEDPQVRERFERETKIIARLSILPLCRSMTWASITVSCST